MYFIVSFQIPLDFILGNELLDYKELFYNYKTINKSIIFSALCLVSFIIGCIVFSAKKNKFNVSLFEMGDALNVKPIVVLIIILWLCFILTLNPAYINGGHGSVEVDNISITFYNYYWKCSILYLAILIWNNKDRGAKSFFRSLHALYILTVLISVLLFLLAHNRVYVIYLSVPILMAYFSFSHRKFSFKYFIIFTLFVAFFMTVFKIFSLSSLFTSDMLSATTDLKEYSGFSRLNSFSPFTAELAGSIYANSLIFDLWYNQKYFFYGLAIITGFMKGIPGLVSVFLFLTDIPVDNIQTALFATKYVGSFSGIGTTCSADLLINVGFWGTIIVMFLYGGVCISIDKTLFLNGKKNIFSVVLALTNAAFVVFLARSSFSDLIGTIVFNYLFLFLYIRKYGKKSSTCVKFS